MFAQQLKPALLQRGMHMPVPDALCRSTSQTYPDRQFDWPDRGPAQLSKQSQFGVPFAFCALMHVEPVGHELLVQLAVQYPPGQPVGWPKIVSGMHRPLLGGRHWPS